MRLWLKRRERDSIKTVPFLNSQICEIELGLKVCIQTKKISVSEYENEFKTKGNTYAKGRTIQQISA